MGKEKWKKKNLQGDVGKEVIGWSYSFPKTWNSRHEMQKEMKDAWQPHKLLSENQISN